LRDPAGSPPREIAKARSALREALQLLGQRRFGTFCAASLLSNMGTWAQQQPRLGDLLSILVSIDRADNRPAPRDSRDDGPASQRGEGSVWRKVIWSADCIEFLLPIIDRV
jgi:hypothetical protein